MNQDNLLNVGEPSPQRRTLRPIGAVSDFYLLFLLLSFPEEREVLPMALCAPIQGHVCVCCDTWVWGCEHGGSVLRSLQMCAVEYPFTLCDDIFVCCDWFNKKLTDK